MTSQRVRRRRRRPLILLLNISMSQNPTLYSPANAWLDYIGG